MIDSANSYHATPYDINATGFYFSTLEEYLEKAENHTNRDGEPVEEYEIQFIDGEYAQLFKSLEIHQTNLNQWFEHFEGLAEEAAIKCLYLSSDRGMTIEELKDFNMDEIYLFEGSAKEYGENYLEETGMLKQIPENLRYYFDYEAFARDMLIGGDIAEFDAPNGSRYIIPQQF